MLLRTVLTAKSARGVTGVTGVHESGLVEEDLLYDEDFFEWSSGHQFDGAGMWAVGKALLETVDDCCLGRLLRVFSFI
jgi:hypothetical protein